MKITLLILNILAVSFCIAWFIIKGGWEPIVTSLAFISSIIYLLFTSYLNQNKLVQKGGKNSKNYQAQGNITVNEKRNKK